MIAHGVKGDERSLAPACHTSYGMAALGQYLNSEKLLSSNLALIDVQALASDCFG